MNTLNQSGEKSTRSEPIALGHRPNSFRIWQLVLLIAAICVLGLQIAPKGDDLIGLNFANSERVEQAYVALQNEMNAGKSSPHLVGSLARAKVQRGDIDGAITLLRKWLDDHPDDQNAKRFLAELIERSEQSPAVKLAEPTALSQSLEATNTVITLLLDGNNETRPTVITTPITNKLDASVHSAFQSLQAARRFEQSGEFNKALHELKKNITPHNEASWLSEFASLNIALKTQTQGLIQLDQIPLSERGFLWTKAWALMAIANNQHNEVLVWLRTTAKHSIDTNYIRDLMYVSTSQKKSALTIFAAQLLLEKSTNKNDRIAASEVLLAAGQATVAVATMRKLRQEQLISATQFRNVLESAWRIGEPVTNELKQEILNPIVARQWRDFTEADILLLLELGSLGELMPGLESLTEANPERWLTVLIDTAQRMKQPALIIPTLIKIADAPQTSASLRSQVGFRLLEINEKKSAEHIFKSLASQAGPKDPTTRQLLFLWGPRPKAAGIDWLVERTNAATLDLKAEWLRLLSERGAQDRVITIAQDLLSHQTDQKQQVSHELIEVFVEALLVRNEYSRLRNFLRERATAIKTESELNLLLRITANLNDQSIDRALLNVGTTLKPLNDKVLRNLGLIAYRNHDWLLAERWLVNAHETLTSDFEINRILGEVYQHNGNRQAAQKFYSQALLLLESNPTTKDTALSRLGLLQRLGRTKEAINEYQWLLTQKPNDQELRADYAALLVSAGDLKTAQTIVGSDRQ
jgi:tetratricopeptide (TPR) repeat protein